MQREQSLRASIETLDPIWSAVRREGLDIVHDDPMLTAFIHACVLNHDTLEKAVAHRIGQRLDHADYPSELIVSDFAAMTRQDASWSAVLRADMQAFHERDPACSRFIEPLLYFKGFHAIQTHRLAHWLLGQGRKDAALYLQSRSSVVFQTDINPAARIGRGLFLDHATGLVVGETARIGDDVSILHGVTLGGTGKAGGDRHPKIGNGVLIGAGAKVLGNIQVGQCSRIAAGSVVLKDVPERATMAGVPARVVGEAGCSDPARSMDQIIASDA
ncbi:MAG: serine O-acetyltransferase [Rhizobiaceae bacterium]|jgi:serine O-acetyltransferase|nr:serine O-acetyltransferase [Rhizobiaceae bacterium]